MKKIVLIAAVVIAIITSCAVVAAPADSGWNRDGSKIAFGSAQDGNNTGAEAAPTATPRPAGSVPEWVANSVATLPPTSSPRPTATPRPTARPAGVTPEPTADPNATEVPEPTETPAATPSATRDPGFVQAGTPEAKTVKVPILLYHHISADFDLTNAISIISPKDFNLHMTAIKTQYTPISLREYVEFVNCTDGSKTLPTNAIIVTFDDGYLSNYEVAFPILKKLEIPATIFVVTDTVGEKAGDGKVNYSHFTWEQAKEMQESGLIEIQSHTNDHVLLGQLDIDTVNYELRKSKYLIEKNLGTTCDMIAYPHGSYTEAAIKASKDAGFIAQCLVGDNTSGVDYEVNIPRDGVMNMTRITVSGTMGNVNIIELVRKAVANKKID